MVRTRTIARPMTHTSKRERELTWQEEMVVRMRQGLSEGDDHVLEMRGAAFEQVRARLIAIEADALVAVLGADELVRLIGLPDAEDMVDFAADTMGPFEPPVSLDNARIDQDLKSRILESLSGFED